MKFQIEKTPFAKALAHVTRVVERRNTYPILANVLIEATKDGRVTLRATDLDIEITEPVAATVVEAGITTVPAGLLSDIVRKFADGCEVSFEMKDDNAIVKGGRSRFNLACLSPDGFPDLKSSTYTHQFDVAGADLAKIIAKTQFAISTEETRYYLNGIYMHVTDSFGAAVLRGVATDGHRLARCECAAPDGSAGMPGIIVPRKTVAEIAKLIDGVETIGVQVSANRIEMQIGDISFRSKLIEGTFPDYVRVTPELSNTIAEIDIKSLKSALDRVSIMSSERGGKAVKFSLTAGALELEVSNADHGTSQEDMVASWDADPVQIGFNAKYAQDVLGVLEGERAKISITEAGAPARVFSEDDPSTLLVLMPMRVA